MIDLHCHILPGIDDGALDLADSVEMARIATADGVERICATPHIRHDHDVRIHELAQRVHELNAALHGESVPVTVLPGGEIAETIVDELDDDELRAVTFGGRGGWALVEPASGPLGDSLERCVGELAGRGVGSVVAHPERHADADVHVRLDRLVRRGALVQLTAAAVLDPRTAGFVAELAERRLVHVLGSDSHSSRHGRPPSLSHAFARLAQVAALRDHIDWIRRDAPAAIVGGEPLEPPY